MSKTLINLVTGLSLLVLISANSFAASSGDAEQGKAKSAQCVACHGVDGNSVNPQWPKIAGQSEEYIYRQLQMFKQAQRVDPLMSSQAATLSEQEMRGLAVYYAAQQMSAGAADEELVEAGELIYRGGIPEKGVPACMSCHGPKGKGNPAALFPRVSYQHAAYTALRLRAYRDGKVGYPGAEIMSGVSERLSDEDIKAVASYVQGLH